ncbi:MAG: HEAT repeat domain-containing protein [Candidatus Anstonellaceae archaeon]
MVPDKGGKPKVRQASLNEPPDERPDSTDRLVAQAFDSDPKVRLRVAQELGKLDDPRAIFALIELSSDKDEMVKEAAQRSLGQVKEEEKETIVSLEKLFAERKEVKKPEEMPQMQQKMMPTIEKLFSHYDPKKRESARRKLLPSLEKLFGIVHKPSPSADPLGSVEKIAHPSVSSAPVAAVVTIQEPEHIPKENAPNFPFGQKKSAPPEAPAPKSDLVEIEEEDREFASASETEEKEIDEQEIGVPSKYYELAYKIATTPGMGKAELKREQNRLISNFKKEVGMAFKMAEERASEEGMASFSNLKPGMKNLSFAEMAIVSITDVLGSKKKHFSKILLSDGKKETAVLVPPERANGITTSDKLALKGVAVDFLVETNEVVLVAKPKSKIIVVK